jgi:hypothetical protein
MIGYAPRVVTNVVVSTGRTTQTVVELNQTSIEMAGIDVRTAYFNSTPEVSTSLQSFNHEEIRRSPGGAGDLNRVIMTMPGVASTSDQINELVVRGGHPIENMTLWDNIELPNTNHFGDQGNTGGPIGMVNVDLIESVDFYTGAFPSIYGDKLSSVMDVKVREGRRDGFAGSFDLSMAGAGFILEGPFGSKKGSALVSYRKSYLDLIKGAVGLTAVPKYYDIQGKVVYDLSRNHRISLSSIGGDDNITITESDDAYSRGVDWVDVNTNRIGAGLNLRSLWGTRGYSVLTVSRVAEDFMIDVRDDDGAQVFKNLSTETEHTIKGKFHYNFSPRRELIAGASYKILGFDHNMWSKDDTVYSHEREEFIPIQGLRLDEDLSSHKIGAFAHNVWRITPRTHVQWGLRYDRFGYIEQQRISPRIGMSYRLSDATTLNAATGIFHQSPISVWLTEDPANKGLDYIRANHYVFGLEHLLRDDTRLMVEFYDKEYSQYPADEADSTRVLISDGTGFSRGFDVFLQKKLTGATWGLISYSYSHSRAHTSRRGSYDWDYDYRHVFTTLFGYRLSNKWEFSGRWRYMGGRPYTPVIDSFEQKPGDWQPIYDWYNPNSVRYRDYNRLDFRFMHRSHYKKWNLVSYCEVENILDRPNIWGTRWNRDERKNENVYQYRRLIVGGFQVEF